VKAQELPLDQAPEGCQHCDAREDGWTELLLHHGTTA
jgi:hypothetical protein